MYVAGLASHNKQHLFLIFAFSQATACSLCPVTLLSPFICKLLCFVCVFAVSRFIQCCDC